MIKKEMEKENMLEDTYGVEKLRWSTSKKMKEHWTLTEDQDQGQDHMEDSHFQVIKSRKKKNMYHMFKKTQRKKKNEGQLGIITSSCSACH